ncbi:MAG: thiamine pyrophosphate-dependent dehydrogenase E1 component subunit alpha [Gemmatimonadetes bacterium]|nr:thiamine pyrophosphate-dependent dehydrogenase E1 component subunit alpha [Gemmatimonadota bacterium]
MIGPLHMLGDLADPSKHQEDLEIEGVAPDTLVSWLRSMLSIRMVEQHLAAMRREGVIGGPVHLGIGQEAVAVGVSEFLSPSDMVFGAHRSHAHLLALGGSIHGLFAEVLGRDTGLSRGMGGSMHLWDQPNGFYGSVPIVAGTVPLAVGAGLASKLRGDPNISVSYLGDGAVEEGGVQESLNLARVLGARVLFVVENNLFSSHMHISLRQPSDSTARFAAAHDITSEVVDGNDVVAVAGAAERLVGRIRRGEGPAFLEAVTYRWLGHVDWREDIDVGVARSAVDVALWKARDPLARLERAMVTAGLWSGEMRRKAASELETEIASAWGRAAADPWPPSSALLDRVYARRAGSR